MGPADDVDEEELIHDIMAAAYALLQKRANRPLDTTTTPGIVLNTPERMTAAGVTLKPYQAQAPGHESTCQLEDVGVTAGSLLVSDVKFRAYLNYLPIIYIFLKRLEKKLTNSYS